MKLVRFNDVASRRKLALKETHGIPRAGDTLVVSDIRADELSGNNPQRLKLADPIEDVITVKLGRGDWVMELIRKAELDEIKSVKQITEDVEEHKGFVVFTEPVTDPEEAERRADAVLKKKTGRKKNIED